MEDRQIYERPKCEKCQLPTGMVFFNGKLLCGDCYVKLDNKIKEIQSKILEEF